MFRSKRWKDVNEITVSMETVHAKTKANKSVHLFLFVVRRKMTLENINSICLLNHNIQVFG